MVALAKSNYSLEALINNSEGIRVGEIGLYNDLLVFFDEEEIVKVTENERRFLYSTMKRPSVISLAELLSYIGVNDIKDGKQVLTRYSSNIHKKISDELGHNRKIIDSVIVNRELSGYSFISGWKDGLFLDSNFEDLFYGGKRAGLTHGEYSLASVFFDNRGKILDLETILKGYSKLLYGHEVTAFTGIDAMVSNLRAKMKGVGMPGDMLKTVKRQGYVFDQANETNLVKDLVFDHANMEVYRDQSPLMFIPSEFSLLWKLASKIGTPIGYKEFSNIGINSPKSAINAVANIRQKLGDDPRNPKYVKTIPGVGFLFKGISDSRKLRYHDLIFDLGQREVFRKEEPLGLFPMEFLVAQAYMRHRGEVVPSSEIWSEVSSGEFNPKFVSNYVIKIKKKLGGSFPIKYIPHLGYVLPDAGYSIPKRKSKTQGRVETIGPYTLDFSNEVVTYNGVNHNFKGFTFFAFSKVINSRGAYVSRDSILSSYDGMPLINPVFNTFDEFIHRQDKSEALISRQGISYRFNKEAFK